MGHRGWSVYNDCVKCGGRVQRPLWCGLTSSGIPWTDHRSPAGWLDCLDWSYRRLSASICRVAPREPNTSSDRLHSANIGRSHSVRFRSEPCINRVWPMTFRFLFDGRHFRSISLAKYTAVFCVDFAANCTTSTTNMSIQYMFMKTMSLYLAVFVYLTLFVHRASSRTKPAN